MMTKKVGTHWVIGRFVYYYYYFVYSSSFLTLVANVCQQEQILLKSIK